LLDFFEQPKHFVYGTSFRTSFCKSRKNTRHISEDATEKSNPVIAIQVAGHLAAKKFEHAGSFSERSAALTKQSTMKPMKPMSGMKPMVPMKAPERWWPEKLGEHPNSAGGQNEMRYAFFADHKRLAVDMGDGKVQLYDTGDHRISGVQQYQSGSGREVTFTSQHGEGDLATLKPV
jgi:hypothetical protein